MEFVSQGGVVRDHAVVRTEHTAATLAQLARQNMAYRSQEQKVTDARQNRGYTNLGPVAFGQYEVGRSSMPNNKEDDGRAVFSNTCKRNIAYPHPDSHTPCEIGDPGAYDPYTTTDIRASSAFTHNRGNAVFGTIAERDLKLNIFGEGTPGPGYYATGRAYRAVLPFVDSNRSVFASTTPQREACKTVVPSPDAYSPNMASVYPNMPDSGSSMRGSYKRMVHMSHPSHVGGEQSQTDERIGPGAYEDHRHNTMSHLLGTYARRKSKLNPGFGAVSPARQLPYGQSDAAPGPGAYQPVVWAGRYGARPRTELLHGKKAKHLRAGGPPAPVVAMEDVEAEDDAIQVASADSEQLQKQGGAIYTS